MINYISPTTTQVLDNVDGHLVSQDKTESFVIKGGIPRFVESDNYALAFGLQWNKFKKTQLDSFTGQPISENRLKLSIGEPLENLKGKLILEAGSGAGRFTEVLAKYQPQLYTFDFSHAVDANYDNNKTSKDTQFFQADIRKIPLTEASFDYVICLGVLQHTPNTYESLASLYKMVKPGGKLIVDHYIPTFGLYTSMYLIYWSIIKRLNPTTQLKLTDYLVKVFFPIHWFFKDSKFMQAMLHRISPINFYYGQFNLSKELHYEWSKLDTHDRNTDHFKRHIPIKKIGAFLKTLGAEKIEAGIARPGVATCYKPEN
jgi:ubiquinone/menaquinone biosynthesis C-methylase UbiE